MRFNVLFVASARAVGLSFHFTRLAIALKKRGHKVVVLSEQKQEEEGLFEELMREKIWFYTLQDLDHLSMKGTMTAARAIGKIIDYHNIDIIHANGTRQMLVVFLASRIFSNKKKVRIVVSVHTTLHGTPYEKATLLVESFLLNICADLFVSIAKSVAKKLTNFGLFSSKVITVYNGIDLELFDKIPYNRSLSPLPVDFSPPSRILVGYSASLIPRKGHKYLIEAISDLSKEFSDVELIITGDGPLKDELKNLSRRLKIEEKIHFTGRIRYKLLYQLLKRIDIYASPSLAELFPFGILEAMVAGKPIVATNVGGVPEAVIDGVNGYLVPPKDPTSLAKAILRLINDPDKARQMGERSRRLAEQRFSMDAITDKLNEVYELALRRK